MTLADEDYVVEKFHTADGPAVALTVRGQVTSIRGDLLEVLQHLEVWSRMIAATFPLQREHFAPPRLVGTQPAPPPTRDEKLFDRRAVVPAWEIQVRAMTIPQALEWAHSVISLAETGVVPEPGVLEYAQKLRASLEPAGADPA